MSPEDFAQLELKIESMERDLNDLKQWKVARMRQQFTMPIDEVSQNLIGAVTAVGLGSKAKTQNIGIASVPTSINVPSAYSGTILIRTPNGLFEVPFL